MRFKLACLGVVFAAVSLLSVPLAATPAGAASPPLEAQMLDMIQRTRIQFGLPPLIVSAGLTKAAENWSDYQLGIGQIEHNPDPGSFLAPFWLRWGEDVGAGLGGPPAIMASFMNSPPHRANILGDYNRIGIGVSTRGDGVDFITLDFEKFPAGV